MRTVTKIVRAQGPKSVFEAVELKAAADLASATAEIRSRLEKIEAALPLKADAEHLIGIVEKNAVQLAKLGAADVTHEARVAELEAREIDRAAMSVMKRVWSWLTTYQGLV